MFTVKATYRNETRKFTFDCSYFPSLKDITEQLVKVFPITESFFLSRLEFSPLQGSPGSFVIGTRALNEEHYNQIIAIYRHKAWPGALLRFTVEDAFALQGFDLPLLSPISGKRKGKEEAHSRTSKRASRCLDDFGLVTPSCVGPFSQRKLPTPPPMLYPVPPPPIIYPSPSVHTSHIPMDVDPVPSQRQPAAVSAQPTVPQNGTSASAPCCDISQGKRDVHEAMAEFMETLTRVMRSMDSNFAIPAAEQHLPAANANAEDAAAFRAQDTSTMDIGHDHIPPIPGSFNEEIPVHKGILCDICSCTIRGIRHKCLDCPDYDMCTLCITNRRHEHASSHEFFTIEEPGHVLVHTVFSGESDSRHSQARKSSASRAPNQESTSPAVHHALCNLCDSRIRGNRYKCLNCPDFDTCETCFRITSEQHPDHSFVVVKDPHSLIVRKKFSLRHFARCDGCQKPIHNVRYKCISCPDFDLCENCEALPIPVHPPTHHMLKMKTPHAAIPSPTPATHITRTPSTNSVIEPTTTVDFSAESAAVDSAPVVRTPTTVLPSSHQSELRGIAMSVPESLQAPSVPDLITFPEISQTQNDSITIPPRPEMLSTASLVPDFNITGEAHRPPLFVCGTQFVVSGPSAVVSLQRASEHEDSVETDAMNQEVSANLPTPVDDLGGEPAHDQIASPARSITPYIPGSLTPSDASSVPRIANFTHDQWQDLWPEMKEVLSNILHHAPVPVGTSASTLSAPVVKPIIYAKLPSDVTTTTTPTDLASLVADEEVPTLSSPAGKSESRLAASPVPPSQNLTPSNGNGIRSVEIEAPLRATFLSDNNIPDGQFFPPGAEFVKSWKMLNDGTRAWPETSQLMFVAGDKLTTENDQGIVQIGIVPPGAEIDVWTGEMKAPEVPGKYVSYWRLNDGQGNHFGHSLWADITVAEPQMAVDTSGSSSLASSAIIMPHSAPERSSAPSENERRAPAAGASVATTDTLSDTASNSSDLSVVDMPSSPSLSSNDSIEWEDAIERTAPPQANVEYVVLYDDSSDDELI